MKRLAPVTRTVDGDMLSPAPEAGAEAYFFSLRRCTRVFRSSLRCFFLDIRLRRFLITEPMLGLLAVREWWWMRFAASPGAGAIGRSGYPWSHLRRTPDLIISSRIEVGVLQVTMHGRFRHPERSTDSYRRQFTRMH